MREDLAARLERMTAAFEETRARIVEANRAIRALRVRRETRDSSVAVVVGPDRTLVDLEISDAAMRRSRSPFLTRDVR